MRIKIIPLLTIARGKCLNMISRRNSNEQPAWPSPAGAAEPTPPETALVLAAREGSTEAFDRLVRMHERQCAAVALRLLGNSHDVAELVQDALVQAFENLHQLKDPARFSIWLLRIVTHQALNRRRRLWRRRAVSLERWRGARASGDDGPDLTAAEPTPDRVAEAVELGTAIQKALDRLPEKPRAALVLFALERMPQKQIAEILECSVEAVKWYVFSSRRRLREDLAEYFK